MTKRIRFAACFLLCAMAVASAGAQTFEPVPGTTAAELSAGGSLMWAAGPAVSQYLGLYQFNAASQQFNIAPSIYSATFASGGGNLYQPDATWAVDYSGYIFSYNAATQTWNCCQYYPNVQGVSIGPGYIDSACHPYEVWMVTSLYASTPLQRYNYCTSVFDKITGTVGLSQVATGGGEVWALDASGHVYRFVPSTSQFTLMTGTLTQIAVGVDGVWGLNSSGQIFEFNPVTQVFNRITGTLSSISVGGNGVWGLNAAHQVFRYEASTRKFIQIAGASLSSISVGTGAGVWGIDSATKDVMAFVTHP
jgi:hypothetical protein